MTETDISYQKKELPAKFLKLGIILLAIGVLLGILVFLLINRERFTIT